MAFVIVATFEYETAEDRTKAIPILKAHGDRCLSDEPGTLTFEIATVNDDDKKLILYEAYESQDAFDLHWSGASLKQHIAENEAAGVKPSFSGVRCTRVD
jgi:quinol monooxygenase YgiN